MIGSLMGFLQLVVLGTFQFKDLGIAMRIANFGIFGTSIQDAKRAIIYLKVVLLIQN